MSRRSRRSRKSKKSRRGRSRRPSRRIARLPRRTQNSIYRWDFHPDPQYVGGSLSGTPGVVTLTPLSPVVPIYGQIGGTQMITYPSVSAIGGGVVDYGLGFTFCLSDLSNHLAFAGLFDQYRVESVTVKVTLLNNVSTTNTLGCLPSIISIPDYDDAVTPTTVHQVRGRQGGKLTEFGMKRSHTFTTRPRRAQVVANSNGSGTVTYSGAAVVPKSQWNDCLFPSIAHFGLKMWIQDFVAPGSAGVTNMFKFDYTYRVAFKGAQLEY